MSKNFEILRSLEKDENLFRTEHGSAVTATPVRARESVRPVDDASTSALSNLSEQMMGEIAKVAQRILSLKGKKTTRIVFAGVDQDEGCAQICAATAEVLSSNAVGEVCLVDANLRSPSLHRCFGLEPQKGVLDAIDEGLPIDQFTYCLRSSELRLVMAGSHSVSGHGTQPSEQVDRLLAELTSRFVLIHSPNATQHADVLTLGKSSDGVVLVIEANATRRETARRAAESLKAAGVPVLGVVLNNRTYPIPDLIYKRL